MVAVRVEEDKCGAIEALEALDSRVVAMPVLPWRGFATALNCVVREVCDRGTSRICAGLLVVVGAHVASATSA